MNKSKSMMLASAVAFSFVAQANAAGDPPKDAKDGAKVKCINAHSCAGKSECKGHGNDKCKGQNSCHGKGFILVTKEECKAKKGEEVK